MISSLITYQINDYYYFKKCFKLAVKIKEAICSFLVLTPQGIHPFLYFDYKPYPDSTIYYKFKKYRFLFFWTFVAFPLNFIK
jgi:hypothetical protein